LVKNLTAENLRREAEYVGAEGRSSFERPYGLAWLLQLSVELREPFAGWMQPLVEIAVTRVSEWLPKLSHPVRSGEHSQSAFSLGLMLDYARAAGAWEFEKLLMGKIRQFYWNDRNGPIGYEPSGEDFLSPCLAEADLMRRVLSDREFASWLAEFLPGDAMVLAPAAVPDRADPKLAHLDGLNLSRAWMLHGIASALPVGDPRVESLRRSAEEHARAGLESVTGEHYEGGHWIGTFAVYLLTAG
jgi:Protein of unknown function (DUF2891)